MQASDHADSELCSVQERGAQHWGRALFMPAWAATNEVAHGTHSFPASTAGRERLRTSRSALQGPRCYQFLLSIGTVAYYGVL